jgi:hypothetical protein
MDLSQVVFGENPRPYDPFSTLLLSGVNILSVRVSNIKVAEGLKYLAALLREVPHNVECFTCFLSTSTARDTKHLPTFLQCPQIKYILFKEEEETERRWWNEYPVVVDNFLKELATDRHVKIFGCDYLNFSTAWEVLDRNRCIKLVSGTPVDPDQLPDHAKDRYLHVADGNFAPFFPFHM